MSYLEELYYFFEGLPTPDTAHYREVRAVLGKNMEKVAALGGMELTDKISNANGELMTLEQQRFFCYGLRLGLELLALTRQDALL